MNVIVAGSRCFTNYRLLCETLAPNAASVTAVITGGARGADQLGETWARTHQVPCHRFPAEWQRLGTAAGYHRNRQMAQAGDILVAFWDGVSNGTAHMIQCMRQLGKPVVVIRTGTTA